MTINVKELPKKTAHVVQKQSIIIFHSKLKPVEAAKTVCYTKVFTICPASFPKAANLLLLARYMFLYQKIFYLKLTIDPTS